MNIYKTKFITKSEQQTINLGKNLAKQFHGGEVAGLIGELGAGKTILIKGLALGLGIKKTITSPTFVLMKIYPVNKKEFNIKYFIHVDAYRLKSGQDLVDIGLNDWMNQPNTLTVIEWADRVKNILPKQKITVKISLGKKENERIIKID